MQVVFEPVSGSPEIDPMVFQLHRSGRPIVRKIGRHPDTPLRSVHFQAEKRLDHSRHIQPLPEPRNKPEPLRSKLRATIPGGCRPLPSRPAHATDRTPGCATRRPRIPTRPTAAERLRPAFPRSRPHDTENYWNNKSLRSCRSAGRTGVGATYRNPTGRLSRK